jgi:hypothetical protein
MSLPNSIKPAHGGTAITFVVKKNAKSGSKGKIILGLFLTEHHAMKAYWGNG